jgi:hypothetical protein
MPRSRRKRISAAVFKAQGKVGRPKEPTAEVSKDALWKRAQRADKHPPNRGMIRHHVDDAYGRKDSKTRYMSRAEHNRLHAKRRRARKAA